ncbi:MAG: 4Fe-4S binding protein [candidate division WOR-3 bacterium]
MSIREFQRSGVLTKGELRQKGLLPPVERLKKGPVVIVECVENIPCNPCAYACPRGAIRIEAGLTNTPKVDFSRCNGCGLCVAKCPGLAIFVVDATFSKEEAAVTLPHELLPRPRVGERVAAVNRAGRVVCQGRVVQVRDAKALDRCVVVTVAVPKRLWNDVRGIRMRKGV